VDFKFKFNNGEKVYVVNKAQKSLRFLTVGMQKVELIDSPGLEGRHAFSNYAPQKRVEESYMCVETGIRSGSVYYPENMFKTLIEATKYLEETNETE